MSVGGLTVDHVLHPAQCLSHWISAETVLIQLGKRKVVLFLVIGGEVKTFLLLNFFNFLKAR